MWSFLESLPGPIAVWPIWRDNLHRHYPAFKSAFLKPAPEATVKFVPCITGCRCFHEVVRQPDGSMLALCRCGACSFFTVLPDDIIPLTLDWPKLARALAAALGLQPKLARPGPYNTFQLGLYQTLPVLLTVQSSTSEFLHALTALLGRLDQPFILLSPTTQFFTAGGRELLQSVGAACFGLDALLDFAEDGSFTRLINPADLFAQLPPAFEPAPDETSNLRAFGLIEKLSAGNRAKSPTVLAVFRLYCVQELSIPQIARKCRCSLGTVANRLRLIRLKTGIDPIDLRKFSNQFATVDRDVSAAKRNFSHRNHRVLALPDSADSDDSAD